MGEERWNPWAALRAHDDLEFGLVPLPARLGGGLYAPQGEWAAILVDSRLGRRARKAVLAHEITHHDRGGGNEWAGQPDGWASVVAREEGRVADIAAERLVPLSQLAEMIAVLEDLGHFPDLWELAEEFDVPEHVVVRALRLLASRNLGQARSA